MCKGIVIGLACPAKSDINTDDHSLVSGPWDGIVWRRQWQGENQDKKKPGIKMPGKFIREASRLGDVGPLSGPWVSRAGRPAKTEKRSGRKLCTAMRCSPLRFE
jgi:hypothetical protein